MLNILLLPESISSVAFRETSVSVRLFSSSVLYWAVIIFLVDIFKKDMKIHVPSYFKNK